MSMKFHRWYSPELQHERERIALERQATQLIKSADRRRANGTLSNPPKPNPTAAATPRRLTFADLKELRRRGLVP